MGPWYYVGKLRDPLEGLVPSPADAKPSPEPSPESPAEPTEPFPEPAEPFPDAPA
jgi:hypothetical protein